MLHACRLYGCYERPLAISKKRFVDQVQPSQVIWFSDSGLFHVAEAAAHLGQHFFAAAEAGADLGFEVALQFC
jgi:hypothetical protein